MDTRDLSELRDEFDSELKGYESNDTYRSAINSMIEENPSDPVPYIKLHFMDAGIYPFEVFDLLTGAIDLCGEDPRLYQCRGMALIQHAGLEEKASRLGGHGVPPKDIEKSIKRKRKRGMKEVMKALELNPDSYETLLSLGNLLDTQGKYLEARKYWKRAVELMPMRPDSWYGLSSSEGALGNHDKALECMKKAMDTLNDDTYGCIKNALSLGGEGIDPVTANFLSIMAALKADMGDIEGAVSDAEECSRLEPNTGLMAMNHIIHHLDKNGMHAESRGLKKRAIGFMVSDDPKKAEYLKDCIDIDFFSNSSTKEILGFAERMADKDDTGEYIKKLRDEAFEAGSVIAGAALHAAFVMKKKKNGQDIDPEDNKLMMNIPVVDTSKDMTYVSPEHKVGRNDPCPCGSGDKYKKCCGKQ